MYTFVYNSVKGGTEMFKRILQALRDTKQEEELIPKHMEDEFFEEVTRRRMENMKSFIQETSRWVTCQIYKDFGEVVPENVAKAIALKLFDMAKEKGDLDILNKLKG